MASLMFIYIIIYLEVLCLDFQARAFENLALGKKARQSSTPFPFWGPEKAVDGVISTSLSTNHCAVTCDDQTTAHWFVDLGKVMAINHVTIYYRMEEQWETKYRGRFAGFYLYIAKDIRKNHGEQYYHEIQTGQNSPSPNMTIECNTLGRYVILYNERDPKVSYPDFYSKIAILELCEVEVYGCQNIRQGECIKCPPNCYKGRCDISSGKCRSCPEGLQGDYCCKPGKYGRNCTERCGFCKDKQPCNSVTGNCANGCSEGFYGDKCITECPLGYYGFKCTGVCSNKCATRSVCDRFTGTCFDGCLPGFSGDRCLNVCRPGQYGRNCRERCGLCKDKKPCDSVTGICANGCSKGFYGDKCIT
ncbi:multiple epidermal growth factor-like domains protein 10, partial [Saccostrea cucullata]|uniref:multiple epidermal growth factor-like domains protein 10 n=1 Tax=Saccostrea cuccullata TaxID=36930 RepID=UPI002ED2508F